MRDEMVRAIIGDVQLRVNFAVHDALSYVYLKDQARFADSGLGGGNFAIAHTQFSLLNLIAKLHFCLHEDGPYLGPEMVERIKDTYKAVKQSGQYDISLLKRLKIPRPYEVNEQLAFCKLINELHRAGIRLFEHDIDDEKLKEVWDGFRNKLAHVSMVKYKGFAIVAIDPANKTNIAANNEAVMAYLKSNVSQSNYKVFTNFEDNWLFCPDVLTVKLREVLNLTIDCVSSSTLSVKSLVTIYGAVLN